MDTNEIIARLRHMVRIGDAMNACRTESNNVLAAAADLLEVDGWVSVEERLPEPHGTYEVRRDGDVHTCTVCYGMHHPWWIAKVFGSDAEPVAFMSGDEWRPLPTPPGGDHD